MSRDETIDPREVEFYSRLADTWWDRNGPFWPLHKLNELRVGYIKEKLCQHFDRSSAAERPLREFDASRQHPGLMMYITRVNYFAQIVKVEITLKAQDDVGRGEVVQHE